MAGEISSRCAHRDAAYWRSTQRLTALLLAMWMATTFGVIFFARELSTISFFGWPLSFYMAAQGTILLYALLLGVYAWRMRQLDKQATENGDGR